MYKLSVVPDHEAVIGCVLRHIIFCSVEPNWCFQSFHIVSDSTGRCVKLLLYCNYILAIDSEDRELNV